MRFTGRDEGLRGELAIERAHVPGAQAQPRQALRIGPEIVADGGHDGRLLAQQAQVVRDVARGSPELAAHVGHHERDVEDVDLVREDVLPELVGKHHDGVVGQRSAHEDGHARSINGASAPTGGIDPVARVPHDPHATTTIPELARIAARGNVNQRTVRGAPHGAGPQERTVRWPRTRMS
jgi:hypothetical protein